MGKKPKKVDYQRAIELIELIEREKVWDYPHSFAPGWNQSDSTKVPASFKLTGSLLVDGDTIEGCYVVAIYRRSLSGLGRDMFSASFFVDNARVIGVDDGKPSSHFNRVGQGLEHYKQQAPHPHLHLPVAESSYGCHTIR